MWLYRDTYPVLSLADAISTAVSESADRKEVHASGFSTTRKPVPGSNDVCCEFHVDAEAPQAGAGSSTGAWGMMMLAGKRGGGRQG